MVNDHLTADEMHREQTSFSQESLCQGGLGQAYFQAALTDELCSGLHVGHLLHTG